MPYSTRISVDLPAPFSPIRAWTSPRRSSSVTSSLATTPGNRLVIPSRTTRGGELLSPAPSSVTPVDLRRCVGDGDLAVDDLLLELVQLLLDVRRELVGVRLRVVESVLGQAEDEAPAERVVARLLDRRVHGRIHALQHRREDQWLLFRARREVLVRVNADRELVRVDGRVEQTRA